MNKNLWNDDVLQIVHKEERVRVRHGVHDRNRHVCDLALRARVVRLAQEMLVHVDATIRL